MLPQRTGRWARTARRCSVPLPCFSPLPPVSVRTGRGHEEEGTDASPSSSRSLPITNSFSKMVSRVPSTPPSGSEPGPPPPLSAPAGPAPLAFFHAGPPYVYLRMFPQPQDVFTPSYRLLSQFNTWWEEGMSP